MEVLAKNLFEIRRERGLTQREVAEKVGITQTALSAYEKGQREPSLGVIVRLAQFYGVSLDSLCGIQIEQVDEQNKTVSRADVLRAITSLLEKSRCCLFDTKSAVDSDDRTAEQWSVYYTRITFKTKEDDWIGDFCNKYKTMLDLYMSGDIDFEDLEAWKERRFAKCEDIKADCQEMSSFEGKF